MDAEVQPYKLVLLGAGGCGKSTLFAQLRTTYGQQSQFRSNSALELKEAFCKSAIESIQELVKMRREQALINLNDTRSVSAGAGVVALGSQAIAESCVGLESTPDVLAARLAASALAVVHNSILQDLGAMTNSDDPTEEETLVMSLKVEEPLTPEAVLTINSVWKQPTMQRIYHRRGMRVLPDNASYILDNILRFVEEDYEPTYRDGLMREKRTTGIVTTELSGSLIFEEEEDENAAAAAGSGGTSESQQATSPPALSASQTLPMYHVLDVGGQRNERKKWIHCFADVTAVVFVANLAGFVQPLFEDETVNRMTESLALLENVTQSPWLVNTPIFIFLNKKDLFDRLVSEGGGKTELKALFPDYGDGDDAAAALEFVKRKYEEVLRAGRPESKLYSVQAGTATSSSKAGLEILAKVAQICGNKSVGCDEKPRTCVMS